MAILTCGLLFLAWRIAVQAVADTLARSNPDQAVRWDGHDPEALANAARQILDRRLTRTNPTPVPFEVHSAKSLTADELAQAKTLSERALLSSPLWGPAFTNLALVAEGQGDAAGAQRLMAIAGDRRLREGVAQDWLFGQAIRSGDFPAAVGRLDIILRTQPSAMANAAGVAAALIAVPEFRAALVQVLGQNPPWKLAMLGTLPTVATDSPSLRALFTALAGQNPPPREPELRAYLARLVREGAYADAFALWSKTVPGNRQQNLRFYNADFSGPLTGSPFDWVLQPMPGFDATIVNGPDGRVLRIGFSGTRITVSNLSHLLVLPPGNYVFSGEVMAEALKTSRGLWWRIACVDKPDQTLGQTELVAGPTGWRSFSASFTVPPGRCAAQQLRLELPARVTLESEISGEVSYRNLTMAAR